MKECELTIASSADGQENNFMRKGEMELSIHCAKVRYEDEGALVCMDFQGETLDILRRGDYTLKISLQRGVVREGNLGIGGNEGAIHTLAHKVAYSISGNSLLATLHYDLLIGDEPQKMKLRILARLSDKGENK